MYANVGEGLRAWVHLQEHFGVSSMFLVGIATDLDLIAVLRFDFQAGKARQSLDSHAHVRGRASVQVHVCKCG